MSAIGFNEKVALPEAAYVDFSKGYSGGKIRVALIFEKSKEYFSGAQTKNFFQALSF